jgi:hypothetical protein
VSHYFEALLAFELPCGTIDQHVERCTVIDDRNPYAPSRASLSQDRVPSGQLSAAVTAWRYRKILVMVPGSTLPDRCVKCNEAADEPTKTRKVYWHHPGVYAFILINIIIYAIVGAIVRKKAMVAAGLCAAHKKRRLLGVALAWTGFVLGIALLFAGIGNPQQGVLAACGVLLLFAAILVGMRMARIVYASKIDKSQVWLKGCGTEFLDSLPPLP